MQKYIMGVLFFILVCIGIKSVSFISNNASNATVYHWPEATSLPREITYKQGGDIEYISARKSYADASGIYNGVNYWTIYINHATLHDVEEYISILKENGVKYFSFDKLKEPLIEYVWPGYFIWWGQSEDCTVKIYLEQQERTDIKNETNESFEYNLTLEVIDEKIWDNNEYSGDRKDSGE